jgi:cysteinyl-tRNA synthetase
VNGTVYFDVMKYNENYHYGKLSGRILDDLITNTRTLEGQDEKRNAADFALWKKAQPEHIMRWPSPWSDGFPGWHLECSTMSKKYLGNHFDIHGGGLDLLFPHHESEIAQSRIANGSDAVKYWIHNNMITINGQKMGKSLGNFITLEEFFTGKNPDLSQPFSPMTIRFFILQAHYRSTLDFSNEALLAAEKGLKKLFSSYETLGKLVPSETSTSVIQPIEKNCYDAMNDDFNSPILIANLFECVRIINSVNDGKEKINAADLELLRGLFQTFVFEILGLKEERQEQDSLVDGLMSTILSIRQRAKENKDFPTSDKIREALQELKITVKDTKDGPTWNTQ